MPKCPICDSWEKTPHAKRFTTPIPPAYAEEAMVIGYWLGIRQPDSSKDLCKKHGELILALDKQQKKRTSPTIPPPPSRTPISQIMGNKSQPAATENQPAVASAELRNSFLAIAQSCATEFLKQHPSLPKVLPIQGTEATTPSTENTTPPVENAPSVPSVSPATLQQALQNIIEHSNDPNAVAYATGILNGDITIPSPTPPPPGSIACIVCHKYVLPGEVHTC